MKIKKLTLSNFMAFENLQLDWSDNINVICGENSTGKTTLLKAMYSLIKPLNEVNRENLTKEMEEQYFVKKLQGVFRPDEMKLGRLVSRKREQIFRWILIKNRKSRLDLAVDRRIMQISIL
jgi:predicted ATP-dependent endonuclease of OLD family